MVSTLNKSILEDTFNSKYNEEQFKKFISDLLVDANFSKEQMIQPIPNDYKDFIRSAKRLCKYTYSIGDYDETTIDVLVVKLKKVSSIDRARTAQRNFIARYLNGGRNYQKDAALVVFLSEDENGNISDDWRLSLVKMDYVRKPVTDANGNITKVKTEVELTPAKRFSFLVEKNGEKYNTHTVQNRFSVLLEKSTTGTKLTIEDLVQAFDIEKVSKEFFDEYKKLYIKMCVELKRLYDCDSKIRKDFDKHKINKEEDLANFAKKTMGQLVFLYFIQKKGWLGVKKEQNWGNGDKNFMRNIFDKKYCDYDNFFNDVLEHLFYEALASDRGTGAWFDKLNCRIPFLNGGLFEPVNGYEYEVTDLTIDNNIFKEIFDTFDLYNFTVKEDEPLEKEVAVDPEMLGKVFENLLPENERKGNGAFYTPREIVHYMCQESLINYLYNKINTKEVPLTKEEKEAQLKLFKKEKRQEQLKLTQEAFEEKILKDDINILIKKGDSTYKNRNVKEELPQSILNNADVLDKALANIKVCDPAIGSGAFPVGMMNEIVRARSVLNPNKPVYELKRNAIENSIYGVDIDPGAVEIAKLRFWLSLVVDEENTKEISPLPNLDYKIMQGNSLITSYEGIDFDKIIDDYKPDTQLTMNLWGDKSKDIKTELSSLLSKFFVTSHSTEKKKLKEQIEGKIIELVKNNFEEKAKKEGKPANYYENDIRKFAQNKENRNFFPWKLFFADAFEQGGFDVVIGNPPYVGQKGNKEKFEKFKIDKKWKNFYERKQDLYYYFIAVGIDLLSKNGVFSYIIPPYFITAEAGNNLRSYIIKKANLSKIINLSGKIKVFENASIDNFIVFLDNQNKDKKIIISEPDLSKTDYMNDLQSYDSKFSTSELSEKEWFILKDTNVIELQSNKTLQLGSIANISPGIQTGCDRVTKHHIEKFGLTKNNIGKGIYVISDEEKFALNCSDFELKYIKPFYKNSDICKYNCYIKQKNEWIIITNEIEDIDKVPNIKKHLIQYKNILDARYRNFALINADKECKWWYLYGYRPNTNFNGTKIVFPYRGSVNKFAYSNSQFYSSIDIFFMDVINPDFDIKYILAILNSNLILYWLNFNCKRKGNIFEFYQKPISQIPIKKVDIETQNKFILIVDKILAITQTEDYLQNQEKQNAVKEYQDQIDIMTYKLYDLTYEEVLIIDKDFKLSEDDYNNYKM